MRDLNLVVFPSFSGLELLGAVNAGHSIALRGIVGQHYLCSFWNIQGQCGFNRIIADRRVKDYRFGTAWTSNDRLGLRYFLACDFEARLDLKAISILGVEIAADESTG